MSLKKKQNQYFLKMIKDIIITPLKILKDERGQVMHMLRCDHKVFNSFGEIYFSTIKKDKIKALHLHLKSTLNYACVKGKAKLVLFDNRDKSETKGNFQEIIISPEKYFLVTIPPGIWNGFKGIDQNETIIANCLNFPHDENEMVRKDPNDKYFNYNW